MLEHKRRTLSFIPLITILVAAGAATLARAEQPPIFPVRDLRPGMTGTAYSVFEGTAVETFPVEVVGVLKNAWGPKQDIVLIRVGGRPAKTGVAAGMSGSPVYIDGKWLGAISLRIGYFPTEPLAGVTPAESMVEIQESDASQPPSTVLAAATPSQQASETATDVAQLLSKWLPAPAIQAQGTPPHLVPIETPLIFSGFSEMTVRLFQPMLQQMGIVAVQGGAEIGTGPMPQPQEAAKDLLPGAAVSAMLLTGDLSLAGTGTVTYNDGKRILAFGHPFFAAGPVEMPMTKAEILTTLGSTFYPFKIANSTQPVGSIVQDRHSGILGVLGRPARMIPVTATVRSSGQTFTYRYEAFQSPQWTPVVLMIALFNTLYSNNLITSQTSLKFQGAIEVKGYPPVRLETFSVNPPESQLPPGLMLASWFGQKFLQLFQNRFERPEISAVDLQVELIPEYRSTTIENVWGALSEVHPGDELPVKIALRPYRGERMIKEATIRIPPNAARGNLRIFFSDAQTITQIQDIFAQQPTQVTSLRELISAMNREKSNQDLYVTLLEPTATAIYDDKKLPSIPSTIANVMDSGRSTSRLTLLNETAIEQFSMPMSVVVTGSQSLTVTVK